MKFASSPILNPRLAPGRSRFVVMLLLGGFLLLIGRSFHLQGFQNDYLQKKGESRYERVIEISATRGRILDRHGDVLAVSTPVRAIWASPEDARPRVGLTWVCAQRTPASVSRPCDRRGPQAHRARHGATVRRACLAGARA